MEMDEKKKGLSGRELELEGKTGESGKANLLEAVDLSVRKNRE